MSLGWQTPGPPKEDDFQLEREEELAELIWSRDELQTQLLLRNKECCGLELMLLHRRKEGLRLEASQATLQEEVEALVAVLEASTVENKALTKEVRKLKRLSIKGGRASTIILTPGSLADGRGGLVGLPPGTRNGHRKLKRSWSF